MRTAKFTVPVSALTGFLEYVHTKGLKSTITSKKEEKYIIQISYTKEQTPIIEELQELIKVLGVLFLASIQTLIDLLAAWKNKSEQMDTLKTFRENNCFFKKFASQA